MATLEPLLSAAEGSLLPARLLIAEGIEKSFRRGWLPRRRYLPVLRGEDLQLGAGEVVGLVGENGSGKSTLMKILVGALAADEAPSYAVAASATVRTFRRSTGD